MRTALIILALLAAPAFAAQTVWKWVDDKGVTHYSDQPVPGAQRVDISTGSRSDAFGSSSSSPRPRTTDQTAELYTEFEIWRPAEQETVVNTGGMVEVRLRFEPALQSGHRVILFLDGQAVPDFPPDGTEITLENIARGTHTVSAAIQDERGKRIKQAPQITFEVRQESIAQPPVGPTLRPQPRPRNR